MSAGTNLLNSVSDDHGIFTMPCVALETAGDNVTVLLSTIDDDSHGEIVRLRVSLSVRLSTMLHVGQNSRSSCEKKNCRGPPTSETRGNLY